MNSTDHLAGRRPLKSRSSQWAQSLARTLLRAGLTPNQVSVLSVVFALGALASFLFAMDSLWLWLCAALGIQLRLLCNLMDGMLALEGGLKSPSGDLFNEFPDRLADTFILAGLGYAGGTEVSALLGWIAACGALMTACVRMHGASLTGRHDFSGPMAKPHRMALATVACLFSPVSAWLGSAWPIATVALAVMVIGIAITLARRLTALSAALHMRAKTPSPNS